MPKICFLFGHRDAPSDILPSIVAAAEYHYTHHGIREYIVGRYGNFDHLALQAVRELKTRHSDVSLILLTPYYRPERQDELPRAATVPCTRTEWKPSPNVSPSSGPTAVLPGAPIRSSAM